MPGLVGLWVPWNWQLWSHNLGVVHRPFSLKHRGLNIPNLPIPLPGTYVPLMVSSADQDKCKS